MKVAFLHPKHAAEWFKEIIYEYIIFELRMWNEMTRSYDGHPTQFLPLRMEKAGLQRGLNPWPRDTGATLIAQLVGASHRYREVTGSNAVKVLNFSGYHTQLQKLRS